MSDDRNLRVCPDCTVTLDIVTATDDRPCQRVEQRCPACGDETALVLLHYPDGRYVGIGDALDDETCDECTATARLRYQPVTEKWTHVRCADHVPGRYWRARAEA